MKKVSTEMVISDTLCGADEAKAKRAWEPYMNYVIATYVDPMGKYGEHDATIDWGVINDHPSTKWHQWNSTNRQPVHLRAAA